MLSNNTRFYYNYISDYYKKLKIKIEYNSNYNVILIKINLILYYRNNKCLTKNKK